MKLSVPYKEVCLLEEHFISTLLEAIDDKDWYKDDYRNKAASMSDVNTIPIHHTPLCATDQTAYCIKSIRKESLFDKFAPHVEPILDKLKEYYAFNQYACFIARLKPHGVIDMHPDQGAFLETCHRIHVPLQTNPKVSYCIEDKEYYWEAGKIYEFDNTRWHGVKNRSDEYRIHLVINLYDLKDNL